MTYQVNWSEPKKFEKGNLGIDETGVYLIGYRDTTTNKRRVVYVGQGDPIGARLSDHLVNNQCIVKKLSLPGRVGYYRYAEVSRQDDRDDIEFGLYQQYGGTKLCNEVEPSPAGWSEDIEVEESFA